MVDLIIIGAGPAGTSAALYAAARGLRCTLFEKHKVGGLIGNVSTVSHYTGLTKDETGLSLSARMLHQLEASGVELVFEEVLGLQMKGGLKEVRTANRTLQGKALILATGSTPKTPEIPGKTEENIHFIARDYLSAVEGREVFVNGGSDGAVKEALALSKSAGKVHIVQIAERLLCIDEFQKKLAACNNIEVHLSCAMTAIKGEGEAIDYVALHNDKTGAVKEFRGEEMYVFAYIGQSPNSTLAGSLLPTSEGYFSTVNEVETGIPGLYAAGDVRVKDVRQMATAVNDGCLAAIKAAAFLSHS